MDWGKNLTGNMFTSQRIGFGRSRFERIARVGHLQRVSEHNVELR